MDPLKATAPQESKLHFLDYWRIIRIRKTVILAVFLLVVITATLVTFILPETYSSTARIKVEHDQSDISGIGDRGMGGGYDPYFIQTEFELIKSEVILTNVINALDLKNVWGKKYGANGPLKTPECINIFKSHLDLAPVRNTSLIAITFYSDKPSEAAQYANAVAEAYRSHRLQQWKDRTRTGVSVLEERFSEQEAKIKTAESNAVYLQETLQIPDSVATESAPTMLMSSESLRHLESQRIENKVDLARQETMLNRFKNILATNGVDALAQVVQTAAPDNQLASFLDQLNIAQQRLLTVEKEYGPEHSEVLKAQATLADLGPKITNRIRGIMLGLDARVASLQEGYDKLSGEVDNARTNDISKSTQSRPYFEAKRLVEELRAFRKILQMKIASESIDITLPKSAMVEIVDTAVPVDHAVRPNKPLNIALGIIIGLVVGVGLAFFIEYLDTSVKTIDDVERSLQAPVLGVIPQNVGLLLDEGAESPHAEAYRVLRTNVLFSRKDDKLNTVAVVSAGAGEGKSTTVFNLASVFAQSGQRVLIVDSDLRRPTLHKMFHVTNSIGLTNYLLKQNTLEEVIQTSNIPTMDFMASGKLPSSSLGILSSAQIKI